MTKLIIKFFTIGLTIAVAASIRLHSRCSISSGRTNCVGEDLDVIKRPLINHENDSRLIGENLSIPILSDGIFERYKFLETLSLRRCEIAEVSENAFRGLNLTHLNLAWNSIERLSDDIFKNFIALKRFDLSHNNLRRLIFRGDYLPSLEHIDVSENRLTSLEFIGDFENIKTLDLRNNYLKKIQNDLKFRLPKIEALLFADNSFEEGYEDDLRHVFTSLDVKVDPEGTFSLNDDWKIPEEENEKKTIDDAEDGKEEIEDERESSSLDDPIDRLKPDKVANIVENTTNRKKNFYPMVNQKLNEFRSKRVRKSLPILEYLSPVKLLDKVAELTCERMKVDTLRGKLKRWSCRKAYRLFKKIIGL